MKTTNEATTGAGTLALKACLASCGKIIAQIRQAKETIFTESRAALQTPERLLRLALNEAEAVAWQTMYPHLVFPALAIEKVQAVADWSTHQQSVRQTSPVLALGA